MSNYPDGMTSRDWAHIDGEEHHEDCPYHEDFQGINNASECYCGIVIGEDDMCAVSYTHLTLPTNREV